jgi:hypothetical protein
VSDSDYADKADLIAGEARIPEDDVKLTVGGRVMLVRVRGLTRAEVLRFQGLASSTLAVERAMLSAAMVKPRMTEGEIREWQDKAPAGELEPLTDRVQELSGVTEDAAREAYRRFATDSAEEFHVLSGGETVDDDDAPTGDDA